MTHPQWLHHFARWTARRQLMAIQPVSPCVRMIRHEKSRKNVQSTRVPTLRHKAGFTRRFAWRFRLKAPRRAPVLRRCTLRSSLLWTPASTSARRHCSISPRARGRRVPTFRRRTSASHGDAWLAQRKQSSNSGAEHGPSPAPNPIVCRQCAGPTCDPGDGDESGRVEVHIAGG
jgi:hypothetical protein